MSDTITSPRSAPRAPERPLNFLHETDYIATKRGGVAGFYVRVRLTSYRSLPLSCIRDIKLTIDGVPVDSADLTFVLDGTAFALAELEEQTGVWWYILDLAELFVPGLLSPGQHEIEGTLSAIVPFATSGRQTSTVTSTLKLYVPSEA